VLLLGVEQKENIAQAFLNVSTKCMLSSMEKLLDIHKRIKNFENNEKSSNKKT
jgi:hypothetical protein